MLLKLLTIACLVACIAAHAENVTRVLPNFIPTRPTEPHWKAPAEYLAKRKHEIIFRDHGCVDLGHPDKHKEYACVNIWLKNKFSEGNVKPSHVFLDYQHPNENKEHAFKPTVTWVENVNPWRVRGCVAAPGGRLNTLGHGKLRWFAVYNMPQNNNQQSGTVDGSALTGNRVCKTLTFPQAFATTPHLKFQIRLKYGLMTSQNALLVWGKAISSTQATYCVEEFYGWSGYHHEFEVQWYGIVNPDNQDDYSMKTQVTFAANELFPTDHKDLNNFYCKNVTLTKWHYPCPSVMVQAFEPNTAVCTSALVAWVAYLKDDQMTVCYADKRGIMGRRKVDVHAHIIVYGAQDKCQSLTCPLYQECVHPTWDTVKCGCHTHCHDEENKVCGTNMMTYKNRCELEKAICESGNKFEYAHHGVCEEYTSGHGRAILKAETGKDCDGLYCAVISTGNRIWYPHAKINVQTTVNWNNKVDGSDASTHDATASWIEDVTPNSFKACVMEAGRSTKAQAPYINWFAYQGKLEKVTTETIEVGDWQSGTHCVPLHQRTLAEKPTHGHKPPSCPRTDLDDHKKASDKEEKYHYDSGMMSKIYGQHQHEWFQRMTKGYGVKKMKLTNGMHLNGATIMLTVEQSAKDSLVSSHDAVNVWMEHDGATEETYVCLREMQNWDGKHKGIHVHWTLLNNTMIRNLGFSHKLMFKPALQSGGFDHPKGQCQTKAFLPKDMDLTMGATALVSITHRIKPYSSVDSMKKYSMHHDMVMQGMNMGEAAMSKDGAPQNSWMMPHMWRANLTGWRPHMRINKDVDYSAWIESMNNTHLTVCQSSTYNGFAHNGVAVNVFILPDRCPQGYYFLNNNMCGKHVEQCTNVQDAANRCAAEGSILAAPQDCPTAVHLSYLARQRDIHTAKTDSAVEGTWQVGFGVPQPATNWFNWAANNPSAGPNDRDCALQGGISKDFKEYDEPCSTCHQYVCVRPAPWLSCGFRKPGFCNDCGTCSKVQPFNFKCDCIPPYHGTHCEVRKPEADQ